MTRGQRQYAKQKLNPEWVAANLARVKAWKAANRDKTKAWEAANAERLKKQRAAYRKANKVRRVALHKAWCEANRGRLNAKRTERRRKNAEKVKAAQAAWYVANAAKVKAKVAAWQRAHPDAQKKWKAKYHAAHREQAKVHNQNRRARIASRNGKLTPNIVPALMKLQRGKCACCRIDLADVKRHLDHIVPLALNGTHTDSNMQLLCADCNLSKHAKHPIEFMQSRGFLL